MRLSILLASALALLPSAYASHAPATSPSPSDLARRSPSLESRAAVQCPALPFKGPLVAAYVPAWTSGAVESVDWSRMDVAFWFCALTTEGGIGLAPGTTTASMKSFSAAATAAGKVPMLTIGGWSGSVYFSDLVSTSKMRAAFANTIKTWLRVYGFKGVDLDWEFVGRQGAGNNIVSPSDSANYLAFLSKLRSTLGASAFISAAVPAAGLTGPAGTILSDVSRFAQYFDWVQLMSYDYYGAWSSTTGPNSPLYSCNAGGDSADATVKRWIAGGFPACKLVLGVPSYSQRWKTLKTKLSTTRYNGASTTAFQALAAPEQQPDNLGWSTKELIKQKVLTADLSKGASGYTRSFDTCTQTPILFNPAGNRKLFITFEDDQSWAAKGAYAKAKGLAGVAVYESTGATDSMWAALGASLGRRTAKTRMRVKRATVFGNASASPEGVAGVGEGLDEVEAGWEGQGRVESGSLPTLLD